MIRSVWNRSDMGALKSTRDSSSNPVEPRLPFGDDNGVEDFAGIRNYTISSNLKPLRTGGLPWQLLPGAAKAQRK